MNPSNRYIQQILPHSLIILGFIVLSFFYTYPVLQGKILLQNDVIQAKGAAQELVKYEQETGKKALWTNSLFGGMPAYMIKMDYPNSLPTHLGRYFVNLLPSPTNIIFWYLFGFYLAMVLLGYNRWLAVLGAFGFAFASYNIINIEAGHVSKCLAIAFAPPFMAAVILAYKGKYWLGGALAGLFAAIHLYANHVQITYYVLISLGLYVIFDLVQKIKTSQLKTFFQATIILAIAGVLAIGSHASRLWTTYEYTNYTIRGKSELTPKDKKIEGGTGLDKDYAFQWSYGISELFTFLVPHFYGGSSSGDLGKSSATYKLLINRDVPAEQALEFCKQQPLYWGNQPFTSGPAYLGAIVCMLFVFSFLVSTSWEKWWLLTVSILFTLLSLGKNFETFNYLMFDYFPLYNKFRAVTMILSVLQIYVMWLIVMGLQELLDTYQTLDKQVLMKKIYYAVGSTAGLALVLMLFSGMFLDFRGAGDEQYFASLQKMTGSEDFAKQILSALRQDRSGMLWSDAFRSFIFILLAGSLLWAWANQWLKSTEYLLAGWIALIAMDMMWVSSRYLNSSNYVSKSSLESRFEPSQANLTIQKDKSIYRVANFATNTFQDAITSYHHLSIGGYHAAKMRRFQELIDNQISKGNEAIFAMFNTKYFILTNEKQEEIVRKNDKALGNAWFVKEYEIVPNADAEMQALSKERFNPAQTAIIDKRFEKILNGLKIQSDSLATIKLVKYAPDELKYESNAQTPQLAVFSEVYYDKGWQAYLDGKPVKHLRANYILRAMPVPAGKHVIEFKFAPQTYYQGEKIALVSSILLALVLTGGLFLHLRFEK
ncbi:MAG: YfhO family protein [Microscillaceae bacterium]|nr:YfhO family protein [Microscillaceae bacterium]MDW8460731.1 YfhO family protein [Cytophagales bacterium]